MWLRLVKFVLCQDEIDMDAFVPWFDKYAIDDVFGVGPGVGDVAAVQVTGSHDFLHVIEVHERLGRYENAIKAAGLIKAHGPYNPHLQVHCDKAIMYIKYSEIYWPYLHNQNCVL